jgi:hypothetical protein
MLAGVKVEFVAKDHGRTERLLVHGFLAMI